MELLSPKNQKLTNMIFGFSKRNKPEKIKLLVESVGLNEQQIELLKAFQYSQESIQKIIDEISENVISNYSFPFSITPNFLINNKLYFIPMVTEESSVVAAVSYAAKFWFENGGFKTNVLRTKKHGHIYFRWDGDLAKLKNDFPTLMNKLLDTVKPLLVNMEKRGGGITDISLNDANTINHDYHIIQVDFETVDSMGANLINSCLEVMGTTLTDYIKNTYPEDEYEPEIIMAILSNYTPDCLVECYVECDISELSPLSGMMSPQKFAGKFERAVHVAYENVSRAVTHNKGIFNGIDAVLMATGNDFRAVEANAHAYAAREGQYRALTQIEINKNRFKYILRMPLALGTIGGATSVHPLAGLSLHIMQNPTAKELMQIVSAAGLASNFAAIRSLITDGIQKGHMKLHLNNILYQLKASDQEKSGIHEFFKDKQVSFKAVSDYIEHLRK